MVAAVRGTEFTMEVTDMATELAVSEGVVDATDNGGATESVSAGQDTVADTEGFAGLGKPSFVAHHAKVMAKETKASRARAAQAAARGQGRGKGKGLDSAPGQSKGKGNQGLGRAGAPGQSQGQGKGLGRDGSQGRGTASVAPRATPETPGATPVGMLVATPARF